jgi:hypothetical protein
VEVEVEMEMKGWREGGREEEAAAAHRCAVVRLAAGAAR